MNRINIYCDGACRGNQNANNIGAWAYVLEYNGKVKEGYGVQPNTTNNAMEITACIKALEQLKSKSIPITINSDSQYVVATMNMGWNKKANFELWEQLETLVSECNSISFNKVKGHSGDKGNERADELCNIAMDEYLNDNPEAIQDTENIKQLKSAFNSLKEFADVMLGFIERNKGKDISEIDKSEFDILASWQEKDKYYDTAVVNVIRNL